MLTFDDVLIAPKFSNVNSRSEVDLSLDIKDHKLTLPVISSNMDTVTGPEMAVAMASYGGIGCLHRFCNVIDNVLLLHKSIHKNIPPMVSVGISPNEMKRAEALMKNSKVTPNIFVIDVAHGAQTSVVEATKQLRSIIGPEKAIYVGNFAGAQSTEMFCSALGNTKIDGLKVGIGPGSACTTRIKTGCGLPQLSSIMEISDLAKGSGLHIIADGGMRTPGDIAKALGAGAHMVMLGGMLAGTDESLGEMTEYVGLYDAWKAKKYRGSASKESYVIQGKDDAHCTAEGESFLVPYKGSVTSVLKDIEGGLRSAFSYVGARNIKEFHEKVEFVRVTGAGAKESGAHGKIN